MTIHDALAGQNLPRTECEILLAAAIGKPRSFLHAHPEHELTADEFSRYAKALDRRRKHEPVQHITGMQEFYGRVFNTDKRALIPRGSTEDLMRIALEFLREGSASETEVDTDIIVTARARGSLSDVRTVVDIGTGSGAIAITLALERPDLRVIATDVSDAALSLARENAQSLGAPIEFRSGSALDPIRSLTEPFIIVSNPPYIPAGRVLAKDVIDFEPHIALFGGPDGSDIARKILEEASTHPWCRGLVMECMRGQLLPNP